MKRPFVYLLTAYAGGLGMGMVWEPSCRALLGLALLTALAGLGWSKRRRDLCYTAVFLAGWANWVGQTAVISPYDLRRTLGDRPRWVAVRGIMGSSPSERVSQSRGREHWRSLAEVEVCSLRRSGIWLPAVGKVLVTTPGRFGGRLFRGEEIEVSGVAGLPAARAAAGLFDYRRYLERRGIHYLLRTASPSAWKVRQPCSAPISDRFQRWARKTLARGLSPEDPMVGLIWAMALGWKTALHGEVADAFRRAGTIHIFAISGLHVALLAGILAGFFRCCRLPRGLCGGLVMLFLWLYTAATGWQSSAIRATLMTSIVVGGWSLKRPSDLLNSLAGAAFLILLWDPRQISQSSFQLSFVAVLSIACLAPFCERAWCRWARRETMLPAELSPWWRKALRKPAAYLRSASAVGLAAWLGILPLGARLFHLVTPISLIANLVIIPLSGLTMVSVMGSWVTAPFLTWISVLFNYSAWFCMVLMASASRGFARMPGASFYVRAPTILQCLFYYGVLAWWRFASGRVRRKGVYRGVGICLVGLLVFPSVRFSGRQATLTLLPVKGGDALLVDAPGKRGDLLVDGGTATAARMIVEPFLHAQGINRLPNLVLTHGDSRHVGGAKELMDAFGVRHVMTSPLSFRSQVYRGIIKRLTRTPRRWIRLEPGARWHQWRILHPRAEDRFALADDGALVMLGEFYGVRVLLCSDLGKWGQRALLDRNADLRADIVVAGLPSRSEPLRADFLERVRPQLILLSTADVPVSERPSRALLRRLEQKGVPVWMTHRDGALTVRLSASGWEAESGSGKRARGVPATGVEAEGFGRDLKCRSDTLGL